MKNKSRKLFFAVMALFAVQLLYSVSLTKEIEVSASAQEEVVPSPSIVATSTTNAIDSRLPLVIGLAFTAVVIVAVFFAFKNGMVGKKEVTPEISVENKPV